MFRALPAATFRFPSRRHVHRRRRDYRPGCEGDRDQADHRLLLRDANDERACTQAVCGELQFQHDRRLQRSSRSEHPAWTSGPVAVCTSCRAGRTSDKAEAVRRTRDGPRARGPAANRAESACARASSRRLRLDLPRPWRQLGRGGPFRLAPPRHCASARHPSSRKTHTPTRARTQREARSPALFLHAHVNNAGPSTVSTITGVTAGFQIHGPPSHTRAHGRQARASPAAPATPRALSHGVRDHRQRPAPQPPRTIDRIAEPRHVRSRGHLRRCLGELRPRRTRDSGPQEPTRFTYVRGSGRSRSAAARADTARWHVRF